VIKRPLAGLDQETDKTMIPHFILLKGFVGGWDGMKSKETCADRFTIPPNGG